jgi:hypothetical protein
VEAVLSESSCSEKLPAPWARVWSNVQKALHVARTTPEHAPRAEAEMQNRLADMYLSISDQVGEEVRCFWHELESVTNQRQQQLFGILNSKIQVRPNEPFSSISLKPVCVCVCVVVCVCVGGVCLCVCVCVCVCVRQYGKRFFEEPAKALINSYQYDCHVCMPLISGFELVEQIDISRVLLLTL